MEKLRTVRALGRSRSHTHRGDEAKDEGKQAGQQPPSRLPCGGASSACRGLAAPVGHLEPIPYAIAPALPHRHIGPFDGALTCPGQKLGRKA
jgi:hypothetical protein